MTITYLKGDATQPVTPGNAIIVHVCNDIGAWGAGFVLAISKRWPAPEAAYRAWASAPNGTGPGTGPDFELGAVQFVPVSDEWMVANLIGQHNVRRRQEDPIPVRYPAIRKGLSNVCAMARAKRASVHMPRIGCGHAGGRWEEIEGLVLSELVNQGIAVFVYDFG
jgi:O-acetyl-ADP-ribose deacetylase (regulator of RNase III)